MGNYGKITNDNLEMAPIQFVENGRVIRGFTDVYLRRKGYMPVVYDNYPDDGDYTEQYEQMTDHILVHWLSNNATD